MSYLGLQPNTPLLNTSTQFLSGNAVATQFTLSRSVASASDIDVMIGNTLKIPFTDYTAGNVSLQFSTPPAAGSNNIAVTYRAGALNSLDLTASVFNAGTAAAPSVVSLAANNTGLYWANATSLSVTVSGTDRVTFNANATSVSNVTGAVVIYGGAGIGGNVTVSGTANITDTTESSSVTTGSFKTAGGAGIVGNLNVGGDITCVGDFTVNGTFTTTNTDSLAVTDPFVFLADNNPGDTYDTGVIAQYYDGANTRYTGYFRDITDAKYKLFTNLLTEPTTTVDTTDPSFQLTDLQLANVSATGNVNATYFVGNGAALTGISSSSSNIFLGNTSVAIPAVNGNVNAVINSVQIANIWSGGISVVGAVAASTTISATANITGGNVLTGGLISATGNVTSAANVSAANVVTGGLISAAGNVTGGNVNATTAVSAGGNVQAGNIRTAGLISAAGDVYGNSFIATSNVQATLNVSATANITGGNILSGGIVSATGNITGSYFLGNGSQLTGIDATSIQNGTSNVKVVSSGGNVTVSVGGTSNVAVFSTSGMSVTANVTGGNLTTAGAISAASVSASGNVTSGNVNTTALSLSGNIISALNASSSIAAGTTISAVGNVTGGNLNAAGLSLSGNVVSALNASSSIAAGTTVSAVGNVTGGNIITGAAMSAASVSASGNVTGGNIITNGAVSAGGLVTATGNVTGGNISTAGLITATGNIASTANVSGGNIIGTLVGNVTGTTVSVTGNITGGNLNAAGLSLSSNVVSALATTANITGGNLISTGTAQAANTIVTGAITTPSWTTTGVGIRSVASVYTDSSTAAAGTAATNHVHVLAQPTIAATNSVVTTTTAATLYIAGAPANGTNMTVTNPWALYVNAGNTFLGGNVSVTGSVTGTGLYKWTASETAPSNPSAGDDWYRPSTDKLYQYWDDGTGSQWVDQSQSTSFDTLAVSGNATITGTLTVTTGALAVGNITNTNANGVGNIGNATGYFNTVFAKSTSAQYADLAEIYSADQEYQHGTVVIFGGQKEITVSDISHDTRVAGVISKNPAHLMNSTATGLPVALTGRVMCHVRGPVRKGDVLVNVEPGVAGRLDPDQAAWGCVLGKSLEDLSGNNVAEIEVVVGRF